MTKVSAMAPFSAFQTAIVLKVTFTFFILMRLWGGSPAGMMKWANDNGGQVVGRQPHPHLSAWIWLGSVPRSDGLN